MSKKNNTTIKTNNSKTQKKEQESKKNKKIKIIAYALGIVFITSIIYSKCTENGFVNWDDDGYILNNEIIKTFSWENIKLIFSSFYKANYHPFTTLSYNIDFTLFGLNPAPYHLINLIYHLINCVLVFYFIYLITKRIEASILVSLFLLFILCM